MLIIIYKKGLKLSKNLVQTVFVVVAVFFSLVLTFFPLENLAGHYNKGLSHNDFYFVSDLPSNFY